MKTKREMDFLSLVLSILVAIQLIPFGLTQVKAESEAPAQPPAAPVSQDGGTSRNNEQDDKFQKTVKVKFSIEGNPVTIELSKDDIKRAIQNKSGDEVPEAIKSLIKKSDKYTKIESEHPDKNIDLDVDFSTITTIIQSQSIDYTIKAGAKVTKKQDLNIEVTFPSESKNEKVTIIVGAADAAKLKDATQDAILKLIKDSDAYKDKLPKLEKYKDKEDKDIELTLVEDALGDVQKYLANGQKDKTTIQAKATVKSVELNPLKITVKFAGTVKDQKISDEVEFTIPGKKVTDLNTKNRTQDIIFGWITGEPGKAAYDKKLQELQATYNVGNLTIDPEELTKFKQFDGKADNQEIIVKAALTAKDTEPSKDTKPSESNKATGTKTTKTENNNSSTSSASASSDDDNATVTIGRRDGENLDKDSKFTIVVVVDPLTQSIVRENSIPMPEGDRFIGQIFRIIIKEDGKPLTRKDMSKLYDINLSLATFEKARKNNLTVYGRSDEDEKWERINRFGYNKDGTLTINGIDTYTEFVVWLDQEKNDRKLQFAGSMNAKDPGNRQGFTPRVLAPYNPQVAGAVSSNPNAYLPTTGEGNFTGWVVATLVLAAAAFAMKKFIK